MYNVVESSVLLMVEKTYRTRRGTIHYWTNKFEKNRLTLIMLPGLSADHRLFAKQIDHFQKTYNILAWDAPGHRASRPFDFDFDLTDKAKWLKKIMDKEKIGRAIIIGQSMGGYVAQTFIELFPKKLAGFVSIDSAPLAKGYVSELEVHLLKHMEPIYRLYPWNTLLEQGSKGVAESEYGQQQMREMMEQYDQKYYAKLVGRGYQMLAKAYEEPYFYRITCPAILICGIEDKAGYTKKYNIRWNQRTGIPLFMVKDAGHNSNADKPEEINSMIEVFIRENISYDSPN